MDSVIHKIGRRKTSVARIYLKNGKGNFVINGKDWRTYFPTPSSQFKINQPFKVCSLESKFDMNVNVEDNSIVQNIETRFSKLDDLFGELSSNIE